MYNNNSLYIITYTDIDTNETIQHEEGTLKNATELYNILKDQTDIENLQLLEYNLITKKYYMMEV